MAKKVLGKGLGALIGSDAVEMERSVSAAIQELPICDIIPNPNQPRKMFDDEALQELSDSIISIGLVQPITVRSIAGGKYEIIAGERRYRAAKLANLETIPAYIRETDNDEVLALALIENIQREDLNAMEVAFSYHRLMEECNLTQEALSGLVGKKRATIANYVRLMNLPAEIQKAVREKELSMGHARALLGLDDVEAQLEIFEQIKTYDLSVRKVEALVQDLLDGVPVDMPNGDAIQQKPAKKKADLGVYSALQDKLRAYFNSKATLVRNENGRGKIVLPFKSDEELEKIISIFDK